MDDTTRELGIQLRDLSRSMRLLRQHRSGDRPGVPAGLVSMLMHIEELSSSCHGRELAARTGLDPSTVSRAVASLVVHGLVERHADPDDGRVSVLAVTAAGRAALSGALDWYGAVLDRVLAGWTPAEITALSTALGRFTHEIDRTLGHPSDRPDTTLEAAR